MRKMVKGTILILSSSVMAACASGARSGDTVKADGTQVLALDCSDGWAKCMSTANDVCGPRGFDEVDRVQDAHVSSSGRLDRQSDGRHIYTEDLQIEDQNQTILIRCR